MRHLAGDVGATVGVAIVCYIVLMYAWGAPLSAEQYGWAAGLLAVVVVICWLLKGAER
jgi:uncharacterized protein (DUF983 family)